MTLLLMGVSKIYLSIDSYSDYGSENSVANRGNLKTESTFYKLLYEGTLISIHWIVLLRNGYDKQWKKAQSSHKPIFTYDIYFSHNLEVYIVINFGKPGKI